VVEGSEQTDLEIAFGCGTPDDRHRRYLFAGSPTIEPSPAPTIIPTKAPSPPSPSPTVGNDYEVPSIQFVEVAPIGDFNANVTVTVGDQASSNLLITCIASNVYYQLDRLLGLVGVGYDEYMANFPVLFKQNALFSVLQQPVYIRQYDTVTWEYTNVSLYFELAFSSTRYTSWCMVEDEGQRDLLTKTRTRNFDALDDNEAFSFATIHAYPLVQIYHLEPGTNHIDVFFTADEPGIVYCAATPKETDEMTKSYTAIFNKGFFAELPGPMVNGTVTGSVRVRGLLALLPYYIYCTSEDFEVPSNKMTQSVAILATRAETVTLCCHDFQSSELPTQLIAGRTEYSNELTYSVTTPPDGDQLFAHGGSNCKFRSVGCFVTLKMHLYLQIAAGFCSEEAISEGLAAYNEYRNWNKEFALEIGEGTMEEVDALALFPDSWPAYTEYLDVSPRMSIFREGVSDKFLAFTAEGITAATYGCWVVRYEVGGSAADMYFEPAPGFMYVYNSDSNPEGPELLQAQFGDSGVYVFITLSGDSDQGAAYHYLRYGNEDGGCRNSDLQFGNYDERCKTAESTNNGYKFGQEEETYNIVAQGSSFFSPVCCPDGPEGSCEEGGEEDREEGRQEGREEDRQEGRQEDHHLARLQGQAREGWEEEQGHAGERQGARSDDEEEGSWDLRAEEALRGPRGDHRQDHDAAHRGHEERLGLHQEEQAQRGPHHLPGRHAQEGVPGRQA
jgi:hypothetical protein